MCRADGFCVGEPITVMPSVACSLSIFCDSIAFCLVSAELGVLPSMRLRHLQRHHRVAFPWLKVACFGAFLPQHQTQSDDTHRSTEKAVASWPAFRTSRGCSPSEAGSVRP